MKITHIFAQFPSPTGVLYISINGSDKKGCRSIYISVPYWGSLYFNIQDQTYHFISEEFPSPIGVLYISISICIFPWIIGGIFPSPIGVLYISIITKTRQELWTI